MDTHTRQRTARTGLVAGLAFALVPIVGISPAHACSCIAASDAEQSLKSADVVFKGTLPKGTQPGGGYGDKDIVLTFTATRVYKGKVAGKQKVRTADSGAACGLELSGAGPFLVFATRPEGKKGGVLEANLCGGTRPIGKNEHPSFGKGKAVKPHKPAPKMGPHGAVAGADGVLRALHAFVGAFGPKT